MNPSHFAHTNIRSINKNRDELFLLLRELHIDIQIIGLTEKWLKAPPDSLLLINGYKCEYKNRQGQSGGGVMLYIKDSLDYTLRPDICSENSFESLFIEIET